MLKGQMKKQKKKNLNYEFMSLYMTHQYIINYEFLC